MRNLKDTICKYVDNNQNSHNYHLSKKSNKTLKILFNHPSNLTSYSPDLLN